jgi:hypothetical protein
MHNTTLYIRLLLIFQKKGKIDYTEYMYTVLMLYVDDVAKIYIIIN